MKNVLSILYIYSGHRKPEVDLYPGANARYMQCNSLLEMANNVFLIWVPEYS